MNDNSLKEARLAAREGDTGAFVRGYFLALESRGVQAAALHGWGQAFDDELSDVDFVLSTKGFDSLVEGVAQHAEESGWHLCQVLRHESTAAFCVCSWSGDPSRVVALDACSDYRRRERVLLSVDDLLADRGALDWGGYRLAEGMELRYRFIKAAIKGKRADELVPELAVYSEESRRDVENWLNERWGVQLKSWQASDVAKAWKDLDQCTLEGSVSGFGAALRRIVWRVMRPTGLVVVNANTEQDAAITAAFSRLYFRRCVKLGRFNLGGIKRLMASTLVRSSKMGWLWKTILGKDLRVEASADESPEALVNRTAKQLHQRCLRRERVS